MTEQNNDGAMYEIQDWEEAADILFMFVGLSPEEDTEKEDNEDN